MSDSTFGGAIGQLRRLLGLGPASPVEVTEPEPAGPPKEGSVLGGRYGLEKRIAGGAAAAVYRGWDSVLDVPVAIKVMLPNGLAAAQAEAGVDATLRVEARTSMLLSHPNIVRVHHYGREGRWEYLVMELVDGLDLSRVRAAHPDKRLPVELVLEIGIDCLEGLAVAHDQGVIHNDIKPGNVLIERSGRAKVCDFGISGLAGGAGLRGAVPGTPIYMSPERLRGEPSDGRSDLYCLACTLYTVSAGREPFGSHRTGAVIGHLSRTMPVAELIPASVDRVLRKAMSKSPDDRYADARAMRDALRVCLVDLRSGGELAMPESETEMFFSAIHLEEPSGGPPLPSSPLPLPPPPPPPPPRFAPPPTGMVVVPPAKVWVGQRECAVEAYALAAHPVTEAEYERYVSATEVAPPEHWRGRKPPVGRARHPVVGVSLEEARQYARWSGLRLPTEAEWTSAVRGAEGRSYPWGEACGEGKTCQCSVVGADGPASVDAHAAGSTPDGVADLLGNVWEWVEAGSGALSLESGHGVALGGSYRHPCTRPGQIPRTEMQVTKRYQYLGFRVASSLVAP